MKTLFLTLYPERMASSRYRVYQYLPYLRSQGMNFDVFPAVPDALFKHIYSKKNSFCNGFYLASEIINRFFHLLTSGRYDVVFVQKSLTTINWEMLLKRLDKKRVIFDIDDNIFSASVSQPTNTFLKKFELENAVEYLCRISQNVIVGNQFLQKLVIRCNKSVYTIPTSIDTNRFFPCFKLKMSKGYITIGWIGGPSTSSYLTMLQGVLKRLCEKYPLKIIVIGDRNFYLKEVALSQMDWQLSNEVDSLRQFDIGIMPMPDNEWTRGKCGLKALQYMSVGIPAVCSPIGVNSEIIVDGQNGFLASTEDDWFNKLSLLIESSNLRMKLGEAGRQTVEEKYSLKVNAPKLKRVIENAYYS